MKGAREGDDRRTPRRGPRDLHRIFGRFCAGREEDRLRVALEGGERVQPLGKRDIGLVGHHLKGRVRVELELFLDRLDHLRMAVAGVQHRDSAREIDEASSFDIPEFGIFGTRREDRKGGRHAARHRALAARDKVLILAHGNDPLEGNRGSERPRVAILQGISSSAHRGPASPYAAEEKAPEIASPGLSFQRPLVGI